MDKPVSISLKAFTSSVQAAVKAAVAREFLREHGVAFRTAPSTSVRSNADVGDIGRQVTILVECWP